MMVLSIHATTRIFLILAVIFLALSIFLFIFLRIPRVFGELTGYTEKKQIKNISKHNQLTGSLSKKLSRQGEPRLTEKIADNSTPMAGLTTLLSEEEDPNKTTLLSAVEPAQTNENIEEHEIFHEDIPDNFRVEVAIGFTSSAETIE